MPACRGALGARYSVLRGRRRDTEGESAGVLSLRACLTTAWRPSRRRSGIGRRFEVRVLAPHRAQLTSPVRRLPEPEAAAVAGPEAAGADRRPVAAAAGRAAGTPRGAPRKPRGQPSPHYATAGGGLLFRQRQTSVPPRLRRS